MVGVSGPLASLSAVTLVTREMGSAVAFYCSLGFELAFGGPDAAFSTFRVGQSYLNLQLDPMFSPVREVWGRVIFWVDDVDAMYVRAVDAALTPIGEPSDAPWGERYFHIRDRDGHELSFARRLP